LEVICQGEDILKKPLEEHPFEERDMSDKALGAVLIAGGGIAGMQAALDLANSGYFVHLVEKSPAIGGTMAQIDKTFPTNDCAM
jgi:heterodisulfide reductase subunit A